MTMATIRSMNSGGSFDPVVRNKQVNAWLAVASCLAGGGLQVRALSVGHSLASVPARRARTSPTVRSRRVGSGSGRCAWIW